MAALWNTSCGHYLYERAIMRPVETHSSWYRNLPILPPATASHGNKKKKKKEVSRLGHPGYRHHPRMQMVDAIKWHRDLKMNIDMVSRDDSLLGPEHKYLFLIPGQLDVLR
jgi:hypothetical protein